MKKKFRFIIALILAIACMFQITTTPALAAYKVYSLQKLDYSDGNDTYHAGAMYSAKSRLRCGNYYIYKYEAFDDQWHGLAREYYVATSKTGQGKKFASTFGRPVYIDDNNFISDGKRLYYIEQHANGPTTLYCANLGTAKTKKVKKLASTYDTQIQLLMIRGTSLYFTQWSDKPVMKKIDLKTLKVSKVKMSESMVALSPDARYMILLTTKYKIYDLAKNKVVGSLPFSREVDGNDIAKDYCGVNKAGNFVFAEVSWDMMDLSKPNRGTLVIYEYSKTGKQLDKTTKKVDQVGAEDSQYIYYTVKKSGATKYYRYNYVTKSTTQVSAAKWHK